MKATTRLEGILPALETAHAIAALPKILAGVEGLPGGFDAGRPARPARLLGSRRQGPGRPRPLRRRRAVGERPMTARRARCATRAGTNGDGRRAAHRGRLRAAREDGRAALIPYVVAGYPDAETSVAIALAAADAGADVLEVGLPYSDPLADGATLQRASQTALAAGATLEGSLAPHRAHRGRPPGPAARAHGLRQPGPRRRRRRDRRPPAGRCRRGRDHRRRPDPRRGRAVRGRRPRRRPGRRLPRRPDDRPGPPRRASPRAAAASCTASPWSA